MNTHSTSYTFANDTACRAFGDGWKAHDSGKPVETNPFPETSMVADEWDDGWYAAAAAKATRYGG